MLDAPRCAKCNTINSFVTLDNKFNLCHDCIKDSEYVTEVTDEYEYNLQQLQLSVDETKAESENFESDLDQLTIEYTNLERKYDDLSQSLRVSQTTLKLVSVEYHKMHHCIKMLQSNGISNDKAISELENFDLWDIDDLVCGD
jgi:predicted nuclease with TOPRIM domain